MFSKKSENWLIVGLGNPGKEYERTRHNAGFRAIDILADKLGCKIDKGKFQGLYGQCSYNGTKLFLLKPLTYMMNFNFTVFCIVIIRSIALEHKFTVGTAFTCNKHIKVYIFY